MSEANVGDQHVFFFTSLTHLHDFIAASSFSTCSC